MITRRALMAAGLCLSAAAAGRLEAVAAAPEPMTVDQFRVLSAALTGVDLRALDVDLARTYLSAFLSTGRAAELARLAAEPGAAAGPLAGEIVAAWYSGVCRTAQGEVLATFNDALIWSALDFTKPFGSCGGETGYWSDAPRP